MAMNYFALALILPLLSAVSALDLLDVYTAGQVDSEGLSYTCFRIPTLLKTKSGDIIAFAEGRRGSCSDQGDVRIVSRRSNDGGKTWSPITQVLNETGHTIGNPSPIMDTDTGVVWLLYARDDNQVWLSSSADEGKTWEKGVNMTASLKPNPDPKAWVATGPPGGVQISSSGRLVTAAYYNRPDGGTVCARIVLNYLLHTFCSFDLHTSTIAGIRHFLGRSWENLDARKTGWDQQHAGIAGLGRRRKSSRSFWWSKRSGHVDPCAYTFLRN